MPKTAKRAEKVSGQYQLPRDLVIKVKVEAAHRGLRPCELVEQVLTDGLSRRREPEPAAAS